MQTAIEDAKASGQWTIRDALWLTAALAMVLGYARSLGPSAIHQAVAYVVSVLILGGLCGLLAWLLYRRRSLTEDLKEALFWGGLVALLFFVAVAGGLLPSPSIAIGWGVAAALCGGLSGVRVPSNAIASTLLNGLLAGVAMILTVWAYGDTLSPLMQFDVLCAAGVGLLIRPLIQFFQWLETQIHHPRIVLASWLTLTFVIGNALVPVLAGVNR